MATADLLALRHNADVTGFGDRFRIVIRVRTKTSGTRQDVAIVTATMAEDHVTEEDIHASALSEGSHLTLTYSQFGSAPTIPVPLDVTRVVVFGLSQFL